MARIGMNPARKARLAYKPKRVTIAVLTYIPSLEGFFSGRLNVLKLSLRSLLENTKNPYELLIVDNGSCPEVVDYLSDLQRKGWIDFLLLSSHNLGVEGGMRLLAEAAQGEFFAFANDDVYYEEGWLEEHLKILEAFPRVGMISGTPVGYSSETAVRSLKALLDMPEPGMTVSHRDRNAAWERDWAHSTGRDLEQHLQSIQDDPQVVVEFHGLKAVGSATHFQFISPLEVIRKALPTEWREELMDGMIELDHEVDRMGYLRLSTFERVTRHIGNMIEGDLKKNAAEMGLKLEKQTRKKTQKHWLLKIPGMGRLLRKVYNKLFKILHHVE